MKNTNNTNTSDTKETRTVLNVQPSHSRKKNVQPQSMVQNEKTMPINVMDSAKNYSDIEGKINVQTLNYEPSDWFRDGRKLNKR